MDKLERESPLLSGPELIFLSTTDSQDLRKILQLGGDRAALDVSLFPVFKMKQGSIFNAYEALKKYWTERCVQPYVISQLSELNRRHNPVCYATLGSTQMT